MVEVVTEITLKEVVEKIVMKNKQVVTNVVQVRRMTHLQEDKKAKTKSLRNVKKKRLLVADSPIEITTEVVDEVEAEDEAEETGVRIKMMVSALRIIVILPINILNEMKGEAKAKEDQI